MVKNTAEQIPEEDVLQITCGVNMQLHIKESKQCPEWQKKETAVPVRERA